MSRTISIPAAPLGYIQKTNRNLAGRNELPAVQMSRPLRRHDSLPGHLSGLFPAHSEFLLRR